VTSVSILSDSSQALSTKISADSYGWIERLLGSPEAPAYSHVFSRVSPGEIVTSVVTLYEVYEKLKPVKGESSALSAVVLLRATTSVPLDDQLALEGADDSLFLHLRFSAAII
jgi:hypothetical protein